MPLVPLQAASLLCLAAVQCQFAQMHVPGIPQAHAHCLSAAMTSSMMMLGLVCINIAVLRVEICQTAAYIMSLVVQHCIM